MSCKYIVYATLAEPMVSYADGLHLDGPLAYAAYRDLTPERRAKLPPIESDWAEDFDLPLVRWSGMCVLPETADHRLTVDGSLEILQDGGGYQGHVWGWKCSAAMPVGPVLESTHQIRKRPNVELITRYTSNKRFDVGLGPLKAKDLALPTVLATRLKWYCVGDPERTLYLLSRHVRAIGKAVRHGMGRVIEWSMGEAEADRSMFDGEGQPMRRLPAAMVPGVQAVLGTFRAPYHHRSRWGTIVEAKAWSSQF